MIITRARLKPLGGVTEFVSIKSKIKALIEKNPKDIFQFVIDDAGIKTIKEFGPDSINDLLVGKEIQICEGPFFAIFRENGDIDVRIIGEPTNESLPRKQTVSQWKKLRSMTKGIDIGDRVSDMNKQGANIQYIQNPIDTGIESYEDFETKNKSFIPSWNLKHLLSPFDHNKKKHKK